MNRVRLLCIALLAAAALALAAGGCAHKKPQVQIAPPDTVKTTVSTEVTSPPPATPEEQPAGAAGEETAALQDVHFDFDAATLSDEAKALLTKNGAWLVKNANVRLRIEGHCDERGTVEYNLALGDRRARAAKDFLVSYGVGESRLEILSYGKEQPLDTGQDETSWAKNRRAHFVVTGR